MMADYLLIRAALTGRAKSSKLMALNTPVVLVPLIPLPGSDPDMVRGGATGEVMTLKIGGAHAHGNR